MILICEKLNQKEAKSLFKKATKWFKNHPEREDCVTDIVTIHRNNIQGDILAISLDGVSLTNVVPPKKKKSHDDE